MIAPILLALALLPQTAMPVKHKHCKTHHITHGVRSRTCSVKKAGK